MKKIFIFFFAMIIIGCSQKEEKNQLPGTFRYLCYHWNNTSNNAGLSLNHFMEIAKDGNYKLILRLRDDSTGYYYGFLNAPTFELLKKFVADTTFKNNYLNASAEGKTLRCKFDFTNTFGRKKITFEPESSPADIKLLQASLDSVINRPDKKTNPTFNINSYLRTVIAEDSLLH